MSKVFDGEMPGAAARTMMDAPPAAAVRRSAAAQAMLVQEHAAAAVSAPVDVDVDGTRTQVELPTGKDMRDVFTPTVLRAHNYLQQDSRELQELPPEAEENMALPIQPEVPVKALSGGMSERDMMRPGDDLSFEDDCDSPQVGELDVQESVALTMNAKPGEGVEGSAEAPQVPEQDEDTREVLSDAHGFKPLNLVTDDPTSVSGVPHEHPSDKMGPIDTFKNNVTGDAAADAAAAETVVDLPDETKAGAGANRTRCSRNRNGHDVMENPLDDLSDDCGMPEPVIPCETPGNSTKCPPKLVLHAPHLPVAEPMPSIPIGLDVPVGKVAVEFVDYGLARTASVTVNETVEAAITAAGLDLGVEGKHIELVRSESRDTPLETRVYELAADDYSLIVYLKCAPKAHQSKLIVKLQNCEDMGVEDVDVRVEVPEADMVVTVHAKSGMSVSEVMQLANVPSEAITKVTYNGARVLGEATLESIHFADRSALIVYVIPAAPTPSTGVAERDASTSASVPTGETQSEEAGTVAGSPETDAGRALPEPVPLPSDDDADSEWPRPAMSAPAVVTVHVEGRKLDIPVLVAPTSTGQILFNALQQRTGGSMAKFNFFFNNAKIETGTVLGPLGFRQGDIVAVQMLP